MTTRTEMTEKNWCSENKRQLVYADSGSRFNIELIPLLM